MENQEKVTVNKIEVDQKTAEPIIVEVPEKEILEQRRKEKLEKYKEYDFIENKSNKSIGKQMAMSRVLGIQKDDSVSKRQKLFKNVFTIIFIVFVVGVLAFTAYNDFFSADESRDPFTWETLSDILSSSWQYLLFALMTLALCFFAKALKLSLMCKSMTGKFHFRTCFETAIIGHYYNSVTPLAVGGQPFEIYHLSKHGIHGGTATSLPIATYFLNQIAFVILAIVGLAFMSYNPLFQLFPQVFKVLAIVGVSCCTILPLLVIVFSLMPRVGATLVHFAMFIGSKLKIVKRPKETTFKTMKTVVQNSNCIKKLASRPLVFFTTFLLSFVEHLAAVTLAFFTLKSFGFTFTVEPLPQHFIVEWVQIVQVCLILNAAITFIPTPGNSGAADLSFYILFASGLAVGLAFPAMVVWRILSFYSYIIIGFIFATLKKKSDAKKALKNEQLN